MKVVMKNKWISFGVTLVFASSLMFTSCNNQHNSNLEMTDYGPSFRTIEEAISFEKYLAVNNDSIGTYELFLDRQDNTESFDSDSFKQLKNLRSLIIYFAEFNSIPESFIHLKKLRNLQLEECTELKTTKGIEKITSLEKLRFDGTSITKIPPEMLALKNLYEFEWKRNVTLFGLDSSLIFLTNARLVKVDFSENKFTEIPVFLKKMNYVRNIYLTDNQINKMPIELLNFERAENHHDFNNIEINLVGNPISDADKNWAKTACQGTNTWFYFGFED